MAEPQPAGIQEGVQGSSAAFSNLDSKMDMKTDNHDTVKQADTEALGKAMEGLDISGNVQKAGSNGKDLSKALVKVDPADVTLLVSRRGHVYVINRA